MMKAGFKVFHDESWFQITLVIRCHACCIVQENILMKDTYRCVKIRSLVVVTLGIDAVFWLYWFVQSAFSQYIYIIRENNL